MVDISLLPPGFFDLLPPEAGRQRQLYQQVMDSFVSFGYEEITPPFIEYDQSLLQGVGESLTRQTFRVMDPLSHEMLGLRADMTPQIARIASQKMAERNDILRLCYAGTCFRMRGEGLQKQRQFRQAGAELIGSTTIMADLEILRCVATALRQLPAESLTVDISLPGLAATLVEATAEAQQLRFQQALQRKDQAEILALNLPFSKAVAALMQSCGTTPDWSLWQAQAADLPQKAGQSLMSWLERCEKILTSGLNIHLSFDPLDYVNEGYHRDFAFSIFVEGLEEEIGRGGRYLLNQQMPAIGFSLYLDSLQRVSQAVTNQEMRCLIEADNNEDDCQRLRDKGWVTIYALSALEDITAAATKNRCSHIFRQGKLVPVGTAIND